MEALPVIRGPREGLDKINSQSNGRPAGRENLNSMDKWPAIADARVGGVAGSRTYDLIRVDSAARRFLPMESRESEDFYDSDSMKGATATRIHVRTARRSRQRELPGFPGSGSLPRV